MHTVIKHRKIICDIVKQIAVMKMYQDRADLLRDFGVYLHCFSNCCLRTPLKAGLKEIYPHSEYCSLAGMKVATPLGSTVD